MVGDLIMLSVQPTYKFKLDHCFKRLFVIESTSLICVLGPSYWKMVCKIHTSTSCTHQFWAPPEETATDCSVGASFSSKVSHKWKIVRIIQEFVLQVFWYLNVSLVQYCMSAPLCAHSRGCHLPDSIPAISTCNWLP